VVVLLVLLLGLVTFGVSTDGSAQESSQPEPQVEAVPEAVADPGVASETTTTGVEDDQLDGPAEFQLDEPTPSDLELIDRLLEEDEEALQGGYVYDAQNRRDPFRSLLVVVEVERRSGPRPEGIPGLQVEQIKIIGVWEIGGRPVVQVEAPDDPKQYLLHEGDRLYDGEVVSIRFTRGEGSEVVLRQRVDDPTAPKPFREIVKRLEP
jgi:hypothetical protein